ncbi:LuxR C-terminal-related transcriptional regulator [Amycolatopsis sp. EV170708-02-1]|uniref:ATP-binding protein n=1 Tax=Amycolatopsis sp. EV170708-02-1 TaxID=2919322 RepID=UPI001F0C10D5|nr:LuxR C-terminal-related transcriptional regulator [Amycolatopsis sp. EV170708-02-1]UMP06786.1 LuxR C-terminal-related transcriptional regulator [Amycolatopsis sp. EV170708-02-1]
MGPPLKRLGSMPVEVSSFVGRRGELVEVQRALTAFRLVTLTGVGGVGKTRLALHVAEKIRRAFPGGVWFVELAALGDSALLEQTVADVLGVRDYSARSPLAALAGVLEAKRLLLVLDNCEHLRDACARLCAELLALAPGLRILATSRHTLCTTGERVFPVSPLPAPDPDHMPGAEELSRVESVRLFVERAAAVLSDFDPDAATRATIARICHRLDGLPLAVELAATRIRVLAPEQILRRLDDRFRFLVGGCRSVPRHRTLQASIDWTRSQCTVPERTLWARVSVFADGFDLDAAEAVCAGNGIEREGVIDLLAALVDKSILTAAGRGRSVHYRMLETLRLYGRDMLLGTGEEPGLRRQHRDYYYALVARVEAGWLGPDQVAGCERLRLEHANVRIALDFCLSEPGEHQVGLAMVAALWTYWIACGAVSEGHHWLTHALALAPEPTPVRAKALWITGWAAQTRGDFSGAATALQECRALAEQLRYEAALAYTVRYAASATMAQGDYSSALTLFEDALARHRALGDKVGVVTLLVMMAFCYCLRNDDTHGDLDHAKALCDECVERCSAVGESWCRSYALYVHGLALWKQNECGAATKKVTESLRLSHALNDLVGIGRSLELLAWMEAADRCGRAATLLGAAATIWRAVGVPLAGITPLLSDRENAEQRARRALGFHSAFQDGEKLSPDQAVAYALRDDATIQISASLPAPESHAPAVTLTRRELQVAELVAQGMSNKEIAARLVIARRTAEGHVERSLAKLGFTKRAQLAAWMAGQRGIRDQGHRPD